MHRPCPGGPRITGGSPIRSPAPRRAPRGRYVAVPAAALACALVLTSSIGDGASRRERAAVAAASTGPLRAPLSDAGYWRFADRMATALDGAWSPRRGHYRSSRAEPLFNANLLLVHSVAAAAGHRGPARRDARARRIAARLVASPPFVERSSAAGGEQAHAPGWVSSMRADAPQHLVFDADLVDGLAAAYRARRALRLQARTARAIADRIHRTVSGRFWRWPAVRLNQINWYALMYTADADVTGDPSRLRGDLRRQIVRFARGARRNFGPGLGFHYLPHRPAGHFMNFDSAEYANIVLSVTRFLGRARRAGMRPLPGDVDALLREWARRAIAGYWTHGGYLNWDTGLGFERWHQTKKLALSQQALIGLAQPGSPVPGERWRAWAKWMLDRGMVLYDRWAHRGVAPGLAFGVNVDPQSGGDARFAAARMAANAARAVAAGLGRARAQRPPALYAFDPGTGRLAVTTPAYNTAIVPVSQGAFPYGGIELARLFDGDQRVAASIGGRPPAAFGVRVHDAAGGELLATQRPRIGGAPPLRLLRAPAGRAVAATTSARRAYAGPFSDLRVRGRATAPAAQAVATYRFRPRTIEARWDVTARGASEVLFPSWGRRARITAGRVRRGAAFDVCSGRSGYRVEILDHPPGATARLVRTRPQSSAPRPGPTLAIELGRGSGPKTLKVRIVPH